MNVKNLKPNENIAAYVERILVIDNYQISQPFSLPLFANGLPSLVFKSTKAVFRNSSTTHLTFFGQTILPETLTFREDFSLIAYFFKPYALLEIFGITAHELTDQPIDLHLLAPKKTIELQEKLLNAGSIEKMIALLDDYIFNLIILSKINNPVIKYAAGKIAQHHSKDILIKVQKELHITERTFQRMFETNIGIAPNLYRRICQFNAAFQQLNKRNHYKLSDIAFENGYADQSHYIRSFKEFTKLTPKDYLNFGAER